jgi:hypothetical protein
VKPERNITTNLRPISRGLSCRFVLVRKVPPIAAPSAPARDLFISGFIAVIVPSLMVAVYFRTIFRRFGFGLGFAFISGLIFNKSIMASLN